MALVLVAEEPHSAAKGASPILRVNVQVSKPLFINSFQPRSPTLRDNCIEADL